MRNMFIVPNYLEQVYNIWWFGIIEVTLFRNRVSTNTKNFKWSHICVKKDRIYDYNAHNISPYQLIEKLSICVRIIIEMYLYVKNRDTIKVKNFTRRETTTTVDLDCLSVCFNCYWAPFAPRSTCLNFIIVKDSTGTRLFLNSNQGVGGDFVRCGVASVLNRRSWRGWTFLIVASVEAVNDSPRSTDAFLTWGRGWPPLDWHTYKLTQMRHHQLFFSTWNF